MTSTPPSLWQSLQRVAVDAGVSLEIADGMRDVSPVQLARQSGLDDQAIERAMAQAAGLEYIQDLKSHPASARFLEQIPIAYARKHHLLGLASDQQAMPVAMANLNHLDELDVLSRYLNQQVRAVIAPAQSIETAINQAYEQRTGQADALIQTMDRRQVLDEVQSLAGREDLLDVATRAPIIKLVNLVLFEAVKQLASDVHIQAYEEKLIIRLRIDGLLFDAFTLPKSIQEEVVSRVKVMAKMNIAEKRLAQDGRATVQVGDRLIDLRVSSIPTSHGERIVIRLLDKSARLYTLGDLGMAQEALKRFSQMIKIEHGLILVTGPTGSGKSTTLYAALQELNSKTSNILTIEDPIEYQLDGISQMQVSDKKGMTFASGLRHVLRQDPDIIMVGEIRDRETAVMAIQSALTGHLVFSTLHTNDAPSAVTRLLDLGIEPYLAASSVVGVMAQRLVRRVCVHCSAPYSPSSDEWELLDLPVEERHTLSGARQGAGCPECRRTGYRGRVGLFEMMPVNEEVRHLIQTRAVASQIKAAACRAGMRTLHQDGIRKIALGQTTIEEVVRVTTRETE